MLYFAGQVDFHQTAMPRGTIVHWARHATACCCRRCMAYWHIVPLTHLVRSDIGYFGQLITLYIKHRLPDLGVKGKGPTGR